MVAAKTGMRSVHLLKGVARVSAGSRELIVTRPGPLRLSGSGQEPDYIQMPPIESFRDAESFYATLAHETTHWTKHPTRLERDFGRKSWGDEGYAHEELVAELGSAFLWWPAWESRQ
jgi:hypothetical protein